jgi:hypothetical protein
MGLLAVEALAPAQVGAGQGGGAGISTNIKAGAPDPKSAFMVH